jgi:hypothetical protein
MYQTIDGEIVGLELSDNGRSCGSHEICGSAICAGSLVRFRLVYPDAQEEVFKVFLVKDGIELCHVGYLPRTCFMNQILRLKFDNKIAQVVEVYSKSTNELKLQRSQYYYGVATFVLINDV